MNITPILIAFFIGIIIGAVLVGAFCKIYLFSRIDDLETALHGRLTLLENKWGSLLEKIEHPLRMVEGPTATASAPPATATSSASAPVATVPAPSQS